MGLHMNARFNADASVGDVLAFIRECEAAGYKNMWVRTFDHGNQLGLTLERDATPTEAAEAMASLRAKGIL